MDHVSHASEFKEALMKYTLKSEEGGLWILAYIFTVDGHKDFYTRILRNDMRSKWGLLKEQEPGISEPADPLQESINDLTEMMFTEDNMESILNDLREDEPLEMEEEDDEMDIRKEEDGKEIVSKEASTQTEYTPRSSNNYCDKAKVTLSQLLEQEGYGERSREVIITRFNWYLDSEFPFPLHRTQDQIGFSWKQIAVSFAEFKPIAEIAMKLLSSSTSEASCERTIYAQRLIHSVKRRNSNKRTLDARLAIMNSSRKPF